MIPTLLRTSNDPVVRPNAVCGLRRRAGRPRGDRATVGGEDGGAAAGVAALLATVQLLLLLLELLLLLLELLLLLLELLQLLLLLPVRVPQPLAGLGREPR